MDQLRAAALICLAFNRAFDSSFQNYLELLREQTCSQGLELAAGLLPKGNEHWPRGGLGGDAWAVPGAAQVLASSVRISQEGRGKAAPD